MVGIINRVDDRVHGMIECMKNKERERKREDEEKRRQDSNNKIKWIIFKDSQLSVLNKRKTHDTMDE